MEDKKSRTLLSVNRKTGDAQSPKAWESQADDGSTGLSLKTWEPEGQCPRAGEDGFHSSSRESEFTLPLPFCSIQALKGLDDARLPRWGWSSLLSLQIQMLPSPSDTLTDTSRNILAAIWATLSLATLIRKIDHHREFVTSWANPFYLFKKLTFIGFFFLRLWNIPFGNFHPLGYWSLLEWSRINLVYFARPSFIFLALNFLL